MNSLAGQPDPNSQHIFSEAAAGTRRLYAFCDAFFTELAGLGVRCAVVSPGSRSAPLALASQRLNQTVVLDERSAGFVALGMAKATRRPVVLICTSGTAAANYLPAVVEASQAQVPLLVLTADRPISVRHWGASQAIDQSLLYANQVRWFAEVTPPLEKTVQSARHFANRAFREADRGGPVHLNWPIDKPLEPPDAFGVTADQPASGTARTPAHSDGNPTRSATLAAEKLSQLADKRGLLIVGSCDFNSQTAQAIANFAVKANWPVLCEATSGLRFAGQNQELSSPIMAYGHFLCACKDLLPPPETVVRVGPNPIDAALLDFLSCHPPALSIGEPDRWDDPDFLVEEIVQGVIGEIFSQATEMVAAGTGLAAGAAGSTKSNWLTLWRQADEAAHRALTSALAEGSTQGLSQAHAAHILSDSLKDDQTLYVASSLAVRDFEFFAGKHPANVRVLSNRGANGIDGTVSSAIGAALGVALGDAADAAADAAPNTTPGAPTNTAPGALPDAARDGSEPAKDAPSPAGNVTLLVGDLALLHDLGALILAGQLGVSLRVVLLNNDGGGIFSQLPIAEAVPAETFKRLFTAPHNLEFDFLGAFPGVSYQKIALPSDLRRILNDDPGSAAPQPQLGAHVNILEVPCDASAHLRQLARCHLLVRKALESIQPGDAPDLPPEPKMEPVQPQPPKPQTIQKPLPLLHATEWSTAGRQVQSKELPVVLLHGFMGSISSMRGIVGDLFHNYRVVAVDLPGHGKSLMPLDPQSFSMETAVELLWKTLADKGISKAHFIGYSMGGRVALSAGVHSAHKVASMVCLGTSPGILDPQERAERQQADWHKADTLLADGLDSFVEAWLNQPLFESLRQRMSKREYKDYLQQRLANDSDNLALSLRYMGTGSMPPLHTSLKDAPFPCLWIAGEDDQKYRSIALEMAQQMPNGQMAVISHSNHATYLENQAATMRNIRNFLASVAG